MSAQAALAPSDLSYLNHDAREFVTVIIGDQTFGIKVTDVRDVFALKGLTPVPGARPEIAGVLNLRGRIVTAIDARQILGLPSRTDGYLGMMAVGIEHDGEAYGILVDGIGDVLQLREDDFVPNPANLSAHWKRISQGVYRLEGKLLITLNVETFLTGNSVSEQGN
jgi:purine-binding chemotaxis protein CheW